jgi:alpha-glucosidase
MPWAPGPGLGFTTAREAWLPFGDRTPADTVTVQRDDPGSPLIAYRALLRLRRAQPGPRAGPVEWLTTAPPVLAYRRGDCVVAANLGPDATELVVPADRAWTLVFATEPIDGVRLPGEAAVVLTAVVLTAQCGPIFAS